MAVTKALFRFWHGDTGLNEQLIGLKYQATAGQFGIFRRGIFSNAERSSAERKQRAHRSWGFEWPGKTVSRICSRMRRISANGLFAWEVQLVPGNGPGLAWNGAPLGEKDCRGIGQPGGISQKWWRLAYAAHLVTNGVMRSFSDNVPRKPSTRGIFEDAADAIKRPRCRLGVTRVT